VPLVYIDARRSSDSITTRNPPPPTLVAGAVPATPEPSRPLHSTRHSPLVRTQEEPHETVPPSANPTHSGELAAAGGHRRSSGAGADLTADVALTWLSSGPPYVPLTVGPAGPVDRSTGPVDLLTGQLTQVNGTPPVSPRKPSGALHRVHIAIQITVYDLK
jgi:hypothetical protein